MVGVPGFGISKSLNVNSGTLPVLPDTWTRHLGAGDAKPKVSRSVTQVGEGALGSPTQTKDQAHVQGFTLCGSPRPRPAFDSIPPERDRPNRRACRHPRLNRCRRTAAAMGWLRHCRGGRGWRRPVASVGHQNASDVRCISHLHGRHRPRVSRRLCRPEPNDPLPQESDDHGWVASGCRLRRWKIQCRCAVGRKWRRRARRHPACDRLVRLRLRTIPPHGFHIASLVLPEESSMSALAVSSSNPIRQIAHRTRGHVHAPITRLISPSDLGEIVKPFVFLDLFENEGKSFDGFGLHPHSGIATLTYIAEGSVNYEDTNGAKGVLGAGAVEWMQAGAGVWHGCGADHLSCTRRFPLSLAFPPHLALCE